ncbi:hypothetical protein [Luteococcus sp. OSA5]|uniref:hypothetical protein n=1 Tax=Luteococcus sp. OSA5 TaxID=3401630 RepID=UPI003B438891
MNQNRYAPDADQDPGKENLVQAPTNPYRDDAEAPGPVDAVGKPELDDSQSDRVREAEVAKDAREAVGTDRTASYGIEQAESAPSDEANPEFL